MLDMTVESLAETLSEALVNGPEEIESYGLAFMAKLTYCRHTSTGRMDYRKKPFEAGAVMNVTSFYVGKKNDLIVQMDAETGENVEMKIAEAIKMLPGFQAWLQETLEVSDWHAYYRKCQRVTRDGTAAAAIDEVKKVAKEHPLYGTW